MGTDPFIQALRIFMTRRENIKSLPCDNDPNFVGYQREFSNDFVEMDHQKFQHLL